MANGTDVTPMKFGVSDGAGDVTSRKQAEEVLVKAGALQRARSHQPIFPIRRK